METFDGVEDKYDELDIIALMFIPSTYNKFNLKNYEDLKRSLQDLSVDKIKELGKVIPDFFTYITPRIMDGILMSMVKQDSIPKEEETSTLKQFILVIQPYIQQFFHPVRRELLQDFTAGYAYVRGYLLVIHFQPQISTEQAAHGENIPVLTIQQGSV